MLGEVGAGVDQAHHFDDALDAVQVATGGHMQGTQQVDSHRAGSDLSQRGVHIGAQLTHPWVAVLFGNMAAHKNQVAGLHKRHIGRYRRCQRRQGNVQVFEVLVNIHGVYLLCLLVCRV